MTLPPPIQTFRIRSCCNGRNLLGTWLLLVLHPCRVYMLPTFTNNYSWLVTLNQCAYCIYLACAFSSELPVLTRQGSWGWSGWTLWHAESIFGDVFWGQTTKCPRSPGLGSSFGLATYMWDCVQVHWMLETSLSLVLLLMNMNLICCLEAAFVYLAITMNLFGDSLYQKRGGKGQVKDSFAINCVS